jgi:hypothetical protein
LERSNAKVKRDIVRYEPTRRGGNPAKRDSNTEDNFFARYQRPNTSEEGAAIKEADEV